MTQGRPVSGKIPAPLELIESIQFLRAAAAVAVLVPHAAYVAAVIGGYDFAVSYMWAASVDTFFLISGFVITYTTRGGLVPAPEFTMRRLIRVVPTYWFYTSIMLAITIGLAALKDSSLFDGGHTLMSYLFLLSRGPDGKIGTLLGMGWTICFEMYFYALYAVMMAFLGRSVLLGISVVFLLGAVLQHYIAAPPFAIVALSYLPLEFLAGSLLALAYMRGLMLPTSVAIAAIFMGLGLIYLAGGLVSHEYDSGRVVYFGVPSVLVVAGFLSLDGRRVIRFPRLSIAIGDASYSLYLSHQFVMLAVGKTWAFLGFGVMLPVWAMIAILMVAPIVFGLMAYRWLERPTTRYLNRLWRQRTTVLAT